MKKYPVKKDSSENRLVEKCNKLTGKNCSSPVWEDHGDLYEEELSSDVVALVVDMSRSAGSLRFCAASDGAYMDMVGQDNKGLVIVCLEAGVRYMCIGQCRVGKVVQLQDSTI